MVITYSYCIIIVHILMDKWQFWYTRKTQDTKWFPFSSICEVFCRKHFLIMCKNIYIVRNDIDPQMIFCCWFNLHALLFSSITVTENKTFLDYINIIDWNIPCTKCYRNKRQVYCMQSERSTQSLLAGTSIIRAG